jgi:dihydroorotate dehydrogenase (NAD+) catalytic subunit
MILDGVEYGNVLNASGARGFYGEGYPFHRYVPGLNYDGSTFVAKTATWSSRLGNMMLDGDLRPRHFKPDCIKVYPLKGVVLNAVGLSNPGIDSLCFRWKKLWGRGSVGMPWMVSIAAVEKEPDQRRREIRMMANVLLDANLMKPYAIQVNLSCPNTGHNQEELLREADSYYTDIRSCLSNPVLFKLNVLVRPNIALRLPGEGFVVSNTLPWGSPGADWKKLFGSDVSPLAHLGGGGLSGKPLLPLVYEWLLRAKDVGISRPIVGGGGILRAMDAAQMFRCGASAVELGSVSILRPWRVANIIKNVNEYCGGSRE